MRVYEGYAPPFRIWGQPVEISEVRGTKPITISIETQSQAKSSFDAEVEYWDGAIHKNDFMVVPGSLDFTFRPNCICNPTIRFRSHSTGQVIRIIDREVRIF
jgi:hypothetical protein